jgi:hypothetical protein
MVSNGGWFLQRSAENYTKPTSTICGGEIGTNKRGNAGH